MKAYMMEHRNEEISFGPKYTKYYFLHYDKEGKTFLMPEENTQATERELNLCGYFVIVTSGRFLGLFFLEVHILRQRRAEFFRSSFHRSYQI